MNLWITCENAVNRRYPSPAVAERRNAAPESVNSHNRMQQFKATVTQNTNRKEAFADL